MVVPGDDHPKVDMLILADRAEALNGKLYMMGGSWDRLYIKDFARPHPFSIAVGIHVPWNATNQDYPLSIRIEDMDGQELAIFGLTFNPGRPPVLRQGQSQRVIFTFQAELGLPGPGTFIVKSSVNDVLGSQVEFHAEQRAAP